MNIKVFQSNTGKDIEEQAAKWFKENKVSKDQIVSVTQSESRTMRKAKNGNIQTEVPSASITLTIIYS